MKYHIGRLVILSGAFVLLSACNGTNATSTAGNGASPAPGAGTGAIGVPDGDIYASKARYIAFLDCVIAQYPASAASIEQSKKSLDGITEAAWPQSAAIFKKYQGGMVNTYASCAGKASPSPSPSPAGGSAGGDIYASKQSYLAFLECAGKKDATAASMAGPLTTAVNVYTDEQWVTVKEVIKVSHKSFIDRYGAGCQ
jgi:hypothetical protein